VGFGGSYPLFVDDPGLPGARYASSEVMRRYTHSAGEPTARIDPFLFKREKPADGYRIVVQGGSTAAGFPYGRWGGLAGMLGDRLEAAFPDREVEVISTAMAAVNSYTLADLVDEIIEIEPDAVLVYAGHNEFVGLLGVGSALTSATSLSAARLSLRLRHLRIYQLIRQLVSFARAAARQAGSADRNTLFALAASGARIPFRSDTYQEGLRQFEANLSELLDKYQQASIPVYIGTLVSNEKDLPPFVGGPAEHVDREQWERLLRAQQAHREAGRSEDARRVLEQMREHDDNAADAWYALGQLEREAGRLGAARQAYLAAVDRDELRFRAPGDFNRLIRELAGRHGATVVEVQQHFADASPDGVIGNELLLEHVHPNPEGYFLLADAYYEALKRDRRIGDWSHAPSREEAQRDMPLTQVDRILGDYHVREMKGGFPFADPPRTVELPAARNDIERLAQRRHRGGIDWIDMMEALLKIHRRQGNLAGAARVARLTAQDYPADAGPNFAAGALLAKRKQFHRARRYLERSLRAEPDDVATLAVLVRVDLALSDEQQLREHLAELQRVAPAHALVRQLKRTD
jgi:tetratricopeptide (TPR) repeat protein